MTLKEAKEYMVEHPGTKFICQVFHDEWIMYDAEKKSLFLRTAMNRMFTGGRQRCPGIIIGGF